MVGVRQTAGGSRNQPKRDFWGWGGPVDPRTAATGPGMSLWLLQTFLDVVAIHSGCHGLERGFFRSEMSAGGAKSFLMQ